MFELLNNKHLKSKIVEIDYHEVRTYRQRSSNQLSYFFKEKEGHKGRKADYSSEDDFIHEEINRAKKLMKKRAYPEADRISNKRMSAEVSNASNDSFTDNTRVNIYILLYLKDIKGGID